MKEWIFHKMFYIFNLVYNKKKIHLETLNKNTFKVCKSNSFFPLIYFHRLVTFKKGERGLVCPTVCVLMYLISFIYSRKNKRTKHFFQHVYLTLSFWNCHCLLQIKRSDIKDNPFRLHLDCTLSMRPPSVHCIDI